MHGPRSEPPGPRFCLRPNARRCSATHPQFRKYTPRQAPHSSSLARSLLAFWSPAKKGSSQRRGTTRATPNDTNPLGSHTGKAPGQAALGDDILFGDQGVGWPELEPVNVHIATGVRARAPIFGIRICGKEKKKKMNENASIEMVMGDGGLMYNFLQPWRTPGAETRFQCPTAAFRDRHRTTRTRAHAIDQTGPRTRRKTCTWAVTTTRGGRHEKYYKEKGGGR